MCEHGLQSQCETTQVRKHGKGAQFFGYSELYRQFPGGQAEYLRVPHADYGAVKVGQELRGPPLPVPLGHPANLHGKAWNTANVPENGTLAV